MGKPDGSHVPSSWTEYIGSEKPTRGSETSQYPEEEKSNETPKVAASEMGRVGRGSELESSAIAGDSPVHETEKDAAGT